jgi:ribosomal protein L32
MEVDMRKDEGLAASPLPLSRVPLRRAELSGAREVKDRGLPRCEMCGSSVLAAHCKRICLKCGFMTGCSEGI